VLAKHSKSFSLIDCVSVGVDRMQHNFEPMRKQVETWQRSKLTDVSVKLVIYEAFIEGKLETPKHLARWVLDLYFEPKYEEFKPRPSVTTPTSVTKSEHGQRNMTSVIRSCLSPCATLSTSRSRGEVCCISRTNLSPEPS
jgi:hypothetical protein